MSRRNHHIVSKSSTKLTEEDLTHVERLALNYLKTHDFLSNRILREIADVTYDQAIFFFSQISKRKVLKVIGAAGATRYIVNVKKPKGRN